MFVWMVYVIFSSIVFFCSSMHSTKDMEGYPSGYLPDCPIPDTDPVITPKTLKHLVFFFHNEGSFLSAKKVPFNYYQMRELARYSQMDFRKKTVLYLGGYLDSAHFPMASSIGLVYKKMGYNVLLMDMNYFTTMEYPLAAVFTRTVGKHAAEMLAYLTKQGLNPKNLELVGLSLGAHTVSFIAKNYRFLTGMNVSRVTGLDPAGPCFRNLGSKDRLDQTDADFVDTVNTNIDGFGMAAPVGHINFYVNGGEFQPGDFVWMPCDILCSHVRAFTLWVSALQNQNSFIAIRCNSVQEARLQQCYDNVPQTTNVVGPKTNRSEEGIFYLATQHNYPYYLGKKGLKKKNAFFPKAVREIISSSDLIL